jgi:hypothetical protein
LEAQAAYYRTQNESARSAGFIPKDAPGYTPNSNPGATVPNQDPASGRFVPGANPVPGSPAYMTADKVYAAVTNASWLANQHMRLYGTPMPDEIDVILREAAEKRLDLRTYADQKYKFTERSNQIAAEKQQQIIDAKVKEGMAAKEKELAERFGNNPNMRQPVTSNYADVARAQAAGERKDPLMLTEQQRREQTRQYITNGIAQQAAGVGN